MSEGISVACGILSGRSILFCVEGVDELLIRHTHPMHVGMAHDKNEHVHSFG